MKFKTTQKFIRTSPRKLREVASLVRGMTPEEAVEKLPHVKKRAATPILKALKTAIANAGQKGVTAKDLILKELQINEGPRYKRWRAGGRGMVKPYQKKTSHIRVVVEAKEKPTAGKKKKTAKDEKEKNAKKKDAKKKGKK